MGYHSNNNFFFLGDIFWLFPAVMLQQIGVCSDTKTDAGQPEQNWNNGKIKDMTTSQHLDLAWSQHQAGKPLGVST